jgi:hypothetical protein
MRNEIMNNKENLIYSYTAEDMMRDGLLLDVSKLAKEAGFSSPVRITSGVQDLINPSEEAISHGQSFEGRLWDVLIVAWVAIKKAKHDISVTFQVFFWDSPNKQHQQTFCATLDTTSGPAIHIILPSEA